MDSCLAQNPDTKFYVLFIDDFDGLISPDKERFEALTLDSLDIPEPRQFVFKYTAFELCCALKPWMISFLLYEKQHEKVIYLDSDIRVFSPLTELFEQLNTADVLVTPHLDKDFPKDGCMPDDGHIMISGIFNAGFIAVKRSESGKSFLEWWQSKLESHCVEDHFNGYFVDQKYLDLAVGLFEGLEVVRNVGCNVAYWNLHSRSISKRGENWYANDSPLVFFHFSDYDLNRPEALSGHQNRFQLKDYPLLDSLFTLYRTELSENGISQSIKWKYGHGYYESGRPIRHSTRSAFLKSNEFHGIRNPFSTKNHTLRLRISSVIQMGAWLTRKWCGRLFRRA